MDTGQIIALAAIAVIVIIWLTFMFNIYRTDGNRATKRPSHQYEFKLTMHTDHYYAFIVDNSKYTLDIIPSGKICETEQEALDWLQERASFLQIEEYEVIRKIG